MIISDAQSDLRRAYVGGGPGILISSLFWFVAAIIQRTQGIGAAFIALFFCGMFIFPASKLACRLLFRRDNEAAGNPLGMTALESTVAMIGGLIAAWLFFPSQPTLVFSLAALAVGTHYLVFKTVYGDRLFWLLGGVLTAIGIGGIFVPDLRGSTTLIFALVQLAFGVALTVRAAVSTNSPAQA